jgi:hypothetical protein
MLKSLRGNETLPGGVLPNKRSPVQRRHSNTRILDLYGNSRASRMALPTVISIRGIGIITLFVGGILFVMSGGSPWSAAGTLNAILGQDVDAGFWRLLIGRFILSVIDASAIEQHHHA